MKKYIVADYVPDNSKYYLTEGKMYLVVNELVGGRNVEIYADDGALIICNVASSSHLGGMAFRVVEVDDTPKKPTGGIRDVETPDTIDTTKAELIYKLDGVFFTKTTIDDEQLATLQAELTHAESRIIYLKKLLATHAKLFPTKE